MKPWLVATLLGFALSSVAPPLNAAASASRLVVGGPAPALAVETWVKGKAKGPIRPGDGRVYVVEFWATWCGPCIAGIPELSKIQDDFRSQGVTVVGCTSRDEWGNTLAAVRDFVRRRDETIRYSIAWLPVSRGSDGTTGVHLNPWYEAAGIRSLPTAFVVDRTGRLAYIGDPAGARDVVAALVNDSFDLESAARKYALVLRGRQDLDSLEVAFSAGQLDRARGMARGVVEGPCRDDARTMFLLAARIGKQENPGSELIDIAVQAAERAVELTARTSPGMLDVLAHALFHRGEIERAIAVEEEATRLSEGDFQKAQIRELERFRQALREKEEAAKY